MLCPAVVLFYYVIIIIIIIIIINVIIITNYYCYFSFLFMCVGACSLSLIFKLWKSIKTFNNILKLPDLCLRLPCSFFCYPFSGKRWGLGFGLRFLT